MPHQHPHHPALVTSPLHAASNTAGPEAPSAPPAAPPQAPEPPAKQAPRTAPPKLDKLPPYKVILHNDDHNPMDHVVVTIRRLTPLTDQQAFLAMMIAHTRGLSLLLTTHKERAELYRDQFASKGLTVTIEPA